MRWGDPPLFEAAREVQPPVLIRYGPGTIQPGQEWAMGKKPEFGALLRAAHRAYPAEKRPVRMKVDGKWLVIGKEGWSYE